MSRKKKKDRSGALKEIEKLEKLSEYYHHLKNCTFGGLMNYKYLDVIIHIVSECLCGKDIAGMYYYFNVCREKSKIPKVLFEYEKYRIIIEFCGADDAIAFMDVIKEELVEKIGSG